MDAISAAKKKQEPLIRLLSDRIVVVIVLAYITGIIAVRFFVEGLPGIYCIGGIFLLCWASLLFVKSVDYYRVILILVVAVAGGLAFFYSLHQPAPGLIDYADSPLYVEGTVIDEPLYFDDHTAYRLKVEIVETGEGRFYVSGTLLVKVYGAEEESYWFGERLRLRGVITEPRGQRNPGGFDYRYYLRSQGIDALIYPKPGLVHSLGQGELNILAFSALNLRSAMVEAISNTLPSSSAELMAAILFGQKYRLADHVEHNFRRAGVGHLMAVSGLHVGLVAALILALWQKLKLRGRWPLVLAIVFVFAYAYLTGMRPSALRAAIMVSTALIALLLDREQDLPTAVAAAALVTLFVNPLLLFTIGFQLSYTATLALIYAYRPLEKLLHYLRCPAFLSPFLAVPLAAQIGVLPLSLYYFHYLPTGALLFNLILLPLIGFVVGLGLSGALVSIILPFLGDLLLWAAHPLLELMHFVTGLSNLPGFYIALFPPGVIFLIIFYGLSAILLLIYYRRTGQSGEEEESVFKYLAVKLQNLLPGRQSRQYFSAGIILGLAVIIIWSGILFPAQKLLSVTFIDVGQGAAAMIETPCGKIIMIDAGGEPAYRGDPGEIGEKVLLPLMRYQGIRSIDLAVISHPHEDHFGGFISLIEAISIKRMIISPIPGESPYYDQLLVQAESAGLEISISEPGQIWSCGQDLLLEIVGPPKELLRGTKSDLNNNSVVFILHYGEVRVLFAGDIEDAAVNDLLRRRVNMKADLLVVPHHGGHMSAMPAFLESVQPTLAVIQVGSNSFGHPNPFVISSLEEAGVDIYRTDHHGAVIIETDGVTIKVKITDQQLTAK